MGTRTGAQRPGSGLGARAAVVGPEAAGAEALVSGSEQDSDSGDDEDAVESGEDGRSVKRERLDKAALHQGPRSGIPSGASGGSGSGLVGVKPGKKTRGRVKIKMEFIDNKLRRYTTFSKRKTGIMKKAYELSTLTGTQVLLLVASETGHVYTFATRKLQPMITSETGKALIQTCLNSPDSPPRCDPSSDQRMSATGFEETDLTYQVTEADSCPEAAKDPTKPAFSLTASPPVSLQGQTSPPPSTNGSLMKNPASVLLSGGITLMSGASLPPGTHTIPLSQVQGQAMTIQGPSAPTATLHAPPVQQATLLRLPTSMSLSGSGVPQQLQTIQVQPSSQQVSTNQNSSDVHSPASSKGSSHLRSVFFLLFLSGWSHDVPRQSHSYVHHAHLVSGGRQQPRRPEPFSCSQPQPVTRPGCGAAGLPHVSSFSRCSDPRFCSPTTPDGHQPAEQQPDGAAGRQPGCSPAKGRLKVTCSGPSWKHSRSLQCVIDERSHVL
ncbi:serum response factor-like isoform X1 [Oryzias latipes]|uniref:serum response factor-like isoform X1 n=1 Tax=Oryzias latipes TaxID=8090 RepID=UPI000CE1DA0F|nr:serum response factor-like isoform X1 [Oryzias latipes]